MMAILRLRGPPLVVAGGAHRGIRDGEVAKDAILARVADACAPRPTAGSAPAKIEVASSIDGKVPERRQLARREVDREALGDRAQIQDERPHHGNRTAPGIEAEVAIGGRDRRVDRALDRCAGAVVAIEAAALQHVADCRIERAAGRLGNRYGKPHRLEEDVAGDDCHASLGREPHRLTVRIEARACRLDLPHPLEGPLDPRRDAGGPIAIVNHLDGHDRAHRGDAAGHLALLSASTTA